MTSPDETLRAAMVADVAHRHGVTDERVLDAMRSVPRHWFVPGVDLVEAYADRAIPTREQDGLPISSASQPGMVAIMLEQLQLPVGGSVLEIGAGTGYNAALLGRLVGPRGRVISVDIDEDLVSEARQHLDRAGITNVEVVWGDGSEGHEAHSPYDGIIVTACAPDLAPAWIDQLARSGRLVLPLSIRGIQQCVVFVEADGHLVSEQVCDCGFVPLRGLLTGAVSRLPVPGRTAVFVDSARDQVEPAIVGAAMDRPGELQQAGGAVASWPEVFGGLRRWLAFREPAFAMIFYMGPPEAAASSGVPHLGELPIGSVTQRFTYAVLGDDGFAAVEAMPGPTPERGHHSIDLVVRRYGSAQAEVQRLSRHVSEWVAAGRPDTASLRIEAWPTSAGLADKPGVIVHRARHTSFVCSW